MQIGESLMSTTLETIFKEKISDIFVGGGSRPSQDVAVLALGRPTIFWKLTSSSSFPMSSVVQTSDKICGPRTSSSTSYSLFRSSAVVLRDENGPVLRSPNKFETRRRLRCHNYKWATTTVLLFRTCYDFYELWLRIDVQINGLVCFAL